MPITFTAEEKHELATARKPVFYRKATIIKNPYNADTRESIEISEHVESWGRIKYSTSLVYKSWEMPNLTLVVVNQDNLFTKSHPASVWQYGPGPGLYTVVAEPRNCHLLIQIYLMRHKGTVALKLLEYRGRIDDVIPRRDEEYSVAELVTVMEQAKDLNERMTKESREHWMYCARAW